MAIMHHLLHFYYDLITDDVMKHWFELCKYVIVNVVNSILFGIVVAVYILFIVLFSICLINRAYDINKILIDVDVF